MLGVRREAYEISFGNIRNICVQRNRQNERKSLEFKILELRNLKLKIQILDLNIRSDLANSRFLYHYAYGLKLFPILIGDNFYKDYDSEISLRNGKWLTILALRERRMEDYGTSNIPPC